MQEEEGVQERKYVLAKAITLNSMPEQIVVHDRELWVINGNAILKYTFHGQRLCHVNLGIYDVRALVASPLGDIIACSGSSGLHHFSPKLKHIGRIADGSYSDVAYADNKLYALEYKRNAIQVFLEGETGGWIYHSAFWLSYCQGYNKLCISGPNLYTSTLNKTGFGYADTLSDRLRNNTYTNCLSIYNLDGAFQKIQNPTRKVHCVCLVVRIARAIYWSVLLRATQY